MLKEKIRHIIAFVLLIIIIIMIKECIMHADFFVTQTLEVNDRYWTASSYHIHINLDNHTMYVYKYGELFKTYPVSGGKVNTPSPVGEWIIISKDRWGEGFAGIWLGLNVPWGKYGIHATNEPWFCGKTNASKGCVRMKKEDARELYSYIPHGTRVVIVQKNAPFRNIKSGDIGSDVLKIQKALKKLGYFPNYCDGKFGVYTKRAIIQYQKDHNLKPTGIVNISTYNKLIKVLF